jgi:hypothetical protein
MYNELDEVSDQAAVHDSEGKRSRRSTARIVMNKPSREVNNRFLGYTARITKFHHSPGAKSS